MMDDPLLETKLDFDEYLRQVSERSLSKVHVRETTGIKSMDVRKIMFMIAYAILFGTIRC